MRPINLRESVSNNDLSFDSNDLSAFHVLSFRYDLDIETCRPHFPLSCDRQPDRDSDRSRLYHAILPTSVGARGEVTISIPVDRSIDPSGTQTCRSGK